MLDKLLNARLHIPGKQLINSGYKGWDPAMFFNLGRVRGHSFSSNALLWILRYFSSGLLFSLIEIFVYLSIKL